MIGSRKQIHGFAVPDAHIALLSQCYALKAVLIKYRAGWVDFSVCSLGSGGVLAPAVAARLMGRSAVCIYPIFKGVAAKGFIVAISPRRYAITDLGREVVAYYWERYNFHRDTIIELERDRLRRLGIED